MKKLFGLTLIFSSFLALAQEQKTLPYSVQIPDAPKAYTAGTVASRVVDGLGWRYYWATEGLNEDDLAYKPSAEARTTRETMEHIYDLVLILKNATTGTANSGDDDLESMTYEQMRTKTLYNIEAAANKLRQSSDAEVASYIIKFKQEDGSTRDFPFWNMLNGPLADAIWHAGQVVSFRRSSGNPFNSKASMFQGKLRE